LEYLADSFAMPTPAKSVLISDAAADGLGAIDARIIDEVDQLHRVVHELEKAYLHDERFEMNLAELRGITERIADQIEQRNLALAK
jgi:hypothetical protein